VHDWAGRGVIQLSRTGSWEVHGGGRRGFFEPMRAVAWRCMGLDGGYIVVVVLVVVVVVVVCCCYRVSYKHLYVEGPTNLPTRKMLLLLLLL